MRFLEPPPETVQVYKKLKYVTEEREAFNLTKFYLKFWIGKSQKPNSYYFNTNEQRQKYIDNLIQAEDRKEKAKAEDKQKRQQYKENFKKQLQVGSILHYSWGYEQTNCEFYQITEIKNSTVKMRRIAAQSVAGEGISSPKILNIIISDVNIIM